MQQINNIHTATINAFASFEIGQAAVVTNVAAHASRMPLHAVSKCSDPMKSKGGALERWRGDSSSRGSHAGSTPPVPTVVPVVMAGDIDLTGNLGKGYPLPANAALPPALWATWVLSRSLCG